VIFIENANEAVIFIENANEAKYSLTESNHTLIRSKHMTSNTLPTYSPIALLSGTTEISNIAPNNYPDNISGSKTQKSENTIAKTATSINSVPIAINDSFSTSPNKSLIISGATLLNNNSDTDGNIFKITAINSTSSRGLVSFDGTNITYNPHKKFTSLGSGKVATDSFIYTVSDGQRGTASAIATIASTGINNKPVANTDSGITTQNKAVTFLSSNLLINDRDPDTGDILKVISVSSAVNGSVTLNAQGNPLFTPKTDFVGNGSFKYVISDGNGGTATATVKVAVNLPVVLPNLVTNTPTNNPGLPAGSDIFTPPFVANAANLSRVATNSSSPEIGEWTRTGQAGDTIVLTGWQFSNLTGASIGQDTKFWVYGQTNANNSVLVQASIQKLDGNVAAITLPNTLPAGSSFLIWAQNSAGYSAPVAINQTESWWVQQTATRGQVASIYGRNLSQNGGIQSSAVYLQDTAGKGYWAPVVKVNPYKVDFQVPTGLANGDYKVYVYNKDGGQYGWSKPLTITVDAGMNYSGQVFNVKNFGAKGDGITDDSNAIQAAIAAADNVDMSTVYLPGGTYLTSQSLFLGWDKVRWLGDGKDVTTIKAADGFDQGFLLEGSGRSKITFQNLTLDANHDRVKNLNVVTQVRDTADLQYLNVKIKAEGATPFDWHNSSEILMKNSDVIGQESFLGTAKQIFIDGTNFYGTGYTDSILHGFGTQMVSITNTTAQNLDTTNVNNGKWAKGRFFTDQSHWGISQNQYFGDNQTIDMAPPPANGIDRNSGEQIMWETEGTASFGAVTGATRNTVSFQSPYSINQPWQLSIVKGKGLGQSKALGAFNSSNNTYQIQGEWNVIPDASSVIVATKIPSNIVVYNNKLDGTAEATYSPAHTASSGVQTYHGAANLIVDRNTFHELRTGVALWSGQSDYFMPAYFTQVTNNSFQDNLTGISFPYMGTSPQQGTNILGAVVRKNSLSDVDVAIDMNMYPSQSNVNVPNFNMNVFQQNTGSTIGQFLSSDQGMGIINNNVMLNNTFI
jgi:hypothetical protein